MKISKFVICCSLIKLFLFIPATAFYRLLPKITLKEEVEGEMAQRLKNMFSPGVIGIEKKSDGKFAKTE